MAPRFTIRPFILEDTEQVVSLWKNTGLTRPWNDPYKDIQRKMDEEPELFLIGELNGHIIGSAMIGYDGHRGWLYYLAIDEQHRQKGYARELIDAAERLLREKGCPKIHLMVRRDNEHVIGLYEHLGYSEVDTVVLGKRLISDEVSSR